MVVFTVWEPFGYVWFCLCHRLMKTIHYLLKGKFYFGLGLMVLSNTDVGMRRSRWSHSIDIGCLALYLSWVITMVYCVVSSDNSWIDWYLLLFKTIKLSSCYSFYSVWSGVGGWRLTLRNHFYLSHVTTAQLCKLN